MDITEKIDGVINETKWYNDMGISNRMMDKKTQVEVLWKPGNKEVKIQFRDLNSREYIGHAMVPTKGMKSKDFLKYIDSDMKKIWNTAKGMKEDINESIFNFSGIFDAGSAGKKKVTLPVVGNDEKAAKKKFEDMIASHVKNGHLPKGKLSNVKVDSKMG